MYAVWAPAKTPPEIIKRLRVHGSGVTTPAIRDSTIPYSIGMSARDDHSCHEPMKLRAPGTPAYFSA